MESDGSAVSPCVGKPVSVAPSDVSFRLERRIEAVRRHVAERDAHALVAQRPENVFYLTGVEPGRGSQAAVVVNLTEVTAVWPDQVPCRLPSFVESRTYVSYGRSPLEQSLALRAILHTLLKGTSVLSDNELSEVTRWKDDEELAAITRNLLGNVAAFEEVRSRLTEGVSDFEIQDWCQRALARESGEGVVWAGSVGLGPNGVRCDAEPTGVRARRGDLLFIDIWSRRHGYVGDSTRTFCVGQAGKRAQQMHGWLEEALERVASLLRPGVSAARLDQACRSVFRRHGVEQLFTHHTGHGLGLTADEQPRLVPGSRDTVRIGDVIAVEPGLYAPDVGGMRLEDVFVVKDEGTQLLASYPRCLFECTQERPPGHGELVCD
jgi:Xaa-Pro aminopeptidase